VTIEGFTPLSALVGGALIGLAVLLGDYAAWDEDQRELARSGPFGLWATVIALQTMAWVLAFPAIRAIARSWRTRAAARSVEIRAATAALVLIGAAVALVPARVRELPDTIPHRGLKMAVLNALAFALAVYAARAMWYAVARLRDVGAGRAVGLRAVRLH
jgi:hypothetical protein